MILAALLLLSGLSISAVAIYYSVVGLTAIFSAAAVPIMIMGISLEVGKLVIASWVKAYWSRIPILMRTYAVAGVAVLMIITSLGIFGFLSKAHSDQTLVSGDVQSKIAVYDEKIKTEKENIEADRKALKQLDEAVDQILGRSTTETGADRAVAIRRSQQKERARLQAEISQSQQSISQLNDARAPIAAEVRKVEAEVGPIKYIAAFVYGDNPDASILERAVTWVIILIVVVFDPLAVVMLLAAQMTWAWYRNPETQEREYVASGSGATVDDLVEQEQAEEATPVEVNKHTQAAVENDTEGEPPAYLSQPFAHFENLPPMPAPPAEREPVLATEPFEVVDHDAEIAVAPTVDPELANKLAESESLTQELVNYIQNLQTDFDRVNALHQASMTREAELIDEIAAIRDDQAAMSIAAEPHAVQLREFTPEEIMALDGRGVDDRLADGEAVSITEMPQDFREMIRRGLDDGTLEIQGADKPLIKALEGEAAYNLMKDIGIFTEDGKLAYEYGGEEPEYDEAEDVVQEDSASEASMAPISQPEPEVTEVRAEVIPEAERPGDYITDPVANLFKRQPETGFGNNFPDNPVRGDLFLRTDFRPTRLFKWNDIKWIEVNKTTTTAYVYNDAYIQFLTDQVLSGVYGWEDLTELEQEQVQTVTGGRRG